MGSTDIDRACKYLDARDRLGDSASADYEQYLTEAALRCVQKDSQKKDAFRNPWIFKALLLTVFPSSALSVYHVVDECNSTVDAIPTSAIAWMMVALFQLFITLMLFWKWRETAILCVPDKSLSLNQRRRVVTFYIANQPMQWAQGLLILFVIILVVAGLSAWMASLVCTIITVAALLGVLFRSEIEPRWKAFCDRNSGKGWFEFLFGDAYKMGD